MKHRFSLVLLVCIVAASCYECAKVSRPTGGPKDEDAPIMIDAKPAHFTTNFSEDEIKIYFDEYVKLKDLNTQLVVSPPLKYPPLITPLGTPSKYITIKILDTLKENTTYTFNFGQSVIDNAEGNILRNYKYVFSTGDIIDSLKVSGTIKDAFNRESDTNISVLLYEFNDSYTDSIIYKEKPLYVGNSLDSTVWEITNIKAGKYMLVALNDVARNYKFDPKQDKIAYVNQFISVPTDTTFIMNMYQEEIPYELQRPAQASKGHIYLGYEGIANNLKIEPLNEPENFRYVTNYEQEKDSLNFWYRNNSTDSLKLKVTNESKIDTVTIRLRSKFIDSLDIKSSTNSLLHLRDTFKLTSKTPIQHVDTTLISLINRDSAKVPFAVVVAKSKDELTINFDKKPKEKYQLEILPEAISDFFDNKNDSLRYTLSTKEPEDYGTIYLTLQNVKSYPIIVQLITEKGKLVEEKYATEQQTFSFLKLVPNKYYIRVIFDTNGNKKWDTGNFLLKLQPERVVYYDRLLDVRANWEMPETFILK